MQASQPEMGGNTYLSLLRGVTSALSGRVFEVSYREIALPIDRFFRVARELGFSAVELRSTQVNPESPPEVIDSVRRLSDETNLAVEMITMRRGKLDAPADFGLFLSYLELAKSLRARQIKLGGSDYSLLCRAAEVAGAVGIRVGSNNHVGSMLETREGTLEYLRRIDHPDFRLHLDPMHLWAMREEIDDEFLDAVMGRISYVIIQDGVEDNTDAAAEIGRREFRATGPDEEGEVGHPALIARLLARGYRGPFGLVAPRAIPL